MSKRKKREDEVDREFQDYFDSLEEQIDFLVNACKMFDQGDFKYAKQLATHVRVLVHDTSQSTSLLNLIGRKDSMRFCSTASFPKNAVFFLGLVNPASRLMIDNQDNQKVEHTFIPNLNENAGQSKKWVDFDTWYQQKILVSNPTHFTRNEMITFVANKDGGAHIDPYVSEKYYTIAKGTGSMLYATSRPIDEAPYQQGEPYKNLHFATIRQIAHELILSVRREFGIRPNYNPSPKHITGMDIEVQEVLIVEGDKIEYER